MGSKQRMHIPEEWQTHFFLWLLGAFIGMGQRLADSENHPIKRYIGHGVISGGLASASGSILLLIPDAPLIAVIGLASAFSTIGTVAMRDLLLKILAKKLETKEDQHD